MNTLSASPRATPHAPRIRMRRIAGLDGLRAIAAGLVLVYHLIPGRAPLGYTGVDIFFVLSGFLITSLLLVSAANDGKPDLRNFWARRFRRLFPAVFLATIGSAALAFIIGGDALVALGRQVIGSLTATYNWIEIAHDTAYFEKSSPLLLTNMWSLAVEQQFYLLWPLLVIVLVAFRTHMRIAVALALAGGSMALHWFLVTDDVTRAYMGTDTHLWGLMFGAALAFAMHRVVVDSGNVRRSRFSVLWGIAGWIALATIVIAGLVVPNTANMYPWGMVGASALAFVVIRTMLPDVVSAPADALRALLNNRVLSWLGVRSYGIYLWHWPLFVLFYYRFPLLDPLLVAVAITALSVLLSDLSYRYVENPIRVMGLGAWFRHIGNKIAGFNPFLAISSIAVPLLLTILAVAAIVTAPAISSGQRAVQDGQTSVQTPRPVEPPPAVTVDPTEEPTDPSETQTDTPVPDREPEPDATATGEPEPEKPDPDEGREVPESWADVTVIGDSVTLAAHSSLEDTMPGIVVDAEESRSVHVALDVTATHEAQGTLGQFVVVSLATNGTITEGQLEQLLERLGPDRTLVLVTGFGPARATWIPEANAAIRSVATRYPDRVLVADWHAAIAGRTELLAGDVTHPGREGGRLYAETIRETLTP